MTTGSPQAAIREAFAAALAGDDERAFAIAAALLEANPADVNALQIAGLVHGRNGRKREAFDAFARADRLAPNQPPILNSLGVLAKDFGDYATACRFFRQAIAAAPNFADARHNLASTLSAAGDREGARAEYEAALRLAPNNIDALGKFSRFLEEEHDVERAAAMAERALALDPNALHALLTRAELLMRSKDYSGATEVLRGAAERAARSPFAVAAIHGKLARAYEKCGRFAEAFQASETANAAQRSEAQDIFGNVEGARTPGTLRRLQAYADAADLSSWTRFDGFADPDPAFLVGFPRSGTTLLDQILSSHGEIAVIEEKENLVDAWKDLIVDEPNLERWNALTREEIADFRSRYWRRAREHLSAPKAIVVDKLPLDTALLGLIHRIFPRARILFALRDPRDAVLSCFQQTFAMNAAMFQFLDLKTAASYYDQVMNLGETWRRRLPLSVHVVRYESVVRDLRREIEPALNFLGVEWRDSVLDYRSTASAKVIRTPSAKQVAEPIYTESSGKWRRYEEHLAPVADTLEKWAAYFGYDPK